jgi:hypothetical protein
MHRFTLIVIVVLALIALVCLSPEEASSGELYTLSIKRMPFIDGPERIIRFTLHIANGAVRSYDTEFGCWTNLDNDLTWNAVVEGVWNSYYDRFYLNYFDDFIVIEKKPKGKLKFEMDINILNVVEGDDTEIRTVPSNNIIVKPYRKTLKQPLKHEGTIKLPAKASINRYLETGAFYSVSINNFSLDKNERVVAFMLKNIGADINHAPNAPDGWHFTVQNSFDYKTYFSGHSLNDKSSLDLDFFKNFVTIERNSMEYDPEFELELITKTGDEYKIYILRNAPASIENSKEFFKENTLYDRYTKGKLFEDELAATGKSVVKNKLQPITITQKDILLIKKFKTVKVPLR